jgi:hypothetical protein
MLFSRSHPALLPDAGPVADGIVTLRKLQDQLRDSAYSALSALAEVTTWLESQQDDFRGKVPDPSVIYPVVLDKDCPTIISSQYNDFLSFMRYPKSLRRDW